MDYVMKICASSYEEYSFPDLIIYENEVFFDLSEDCVLGNAADITSKKLRSLLEYLSVPLTKNSPELKRGH